MTGPALRPSAAARGVQIAVVPAAGFGKRIRALAGGRAKEMIRVGARTLIEHALADLQSGGLVSVVIVISPDKEGLRTYVGDRWGSLAVEYIYQQRPDGVARAIALARDVVGKRPFVAFMPDNYCATGPGLTVQLVRAYDAHPGYVLGLLELDASRLGQFGAAGFVEAAPIREASPTGCSPRVVRISKVHDKGERPDPPASQRLLKGFPASLLLPDFFERACRLSPSARSGEYEDTPILQELAAAGKVIGAVLEGVVFDCGIPEGLLAARRYLEAAPSEG
ncbi:MAG: sugar phosphate nucleotidyltransferase [Planctomycetota bacterium]